MIESSLGQVVAGYDLSMRQTADAIDAIMRGQVSDAQVGLLLTAWRAKGESVEEVAGAAAAMRAHMTPIRTTRGGVLDTCGTGGDASQTFNISTAAALVAAAAGVVVAKHGNRGISSRTGSADALAALGVNVEAEVAAVEACLEEVGICFCFAPRLHPSMRHVAEIRRKLGGPTIFNLLGPLCNPASAPFQLLGVGRRDTARLLAAALGLLGTERSIVVTGGDGLDEVTLDGPTHVIEIRAGGKNAAEHCDLTLEPGDFTLEPGDLRSMPSDLTWTPGDFGLAPRDLAAIRVTGPDESAATIRRVLAGEPGTAREIVLANAAAALWVAGKAETLREGVRLAGAAIDSGAAEDVLARLVEFSHRPAP